MKSLETVRFAIVGAGKVGTALARLLSHEGYKFLGAASRSLTSAQATCDFAGCGQATSEAAEITADADLIFITTPDDVIAEVCTNLAQASAFRSGAVVAHCSGAHPSTILAPAAEAGAEIGSMHPLQSFATADEAVKVLPGSYCCIEGTEQAVTVLSGAAEAIGSQVMTVPTKHKALYHAAAVVACNYLVALENAALRLDEAAGLDREDAREALLPLIKGTINNLENVGIPDCLTGPIARGDVETTQRHIEAMEQEIPDLLPLYKQLGIETVSVARAKGTLSEARAEKLLEMFETE
jgi:predicted short-subunit dehydrogenase-like oxidoreductase (DUF2520 family)